MTRSPRPSNDAGARPVGSEGGAAGYAACYDGHIFVDTVSLHERAAMVNWLVVYGGFAVPIGMGDFAIRDHFARLAKPMNVTVSPVRIDLATRSEHPL